MAQHFEVATIKTEIVYSVWCPYCQHKHRYTKDIADDYSSITIDNTIKCSGCGRWFATTEQEEE